MTRQHRYYRYISQCCPKIIYNTLMICKKTRRSNYKHNRESVPNSRKSRNNDFKFLKIGKTNFLFIMKKYHFLAVLGVMLIGAFFASCNHEELNPAESTTALSRPPTTDPDKPWRTAYPEENGYVKSQQEVVILSILRL